MRRQIEFPLGDPRNQDRLLVLVTAMLTVKEGRGTGLELLRREGRILDALESVSTGDGQARLVTDGAVLTLHQSDFELVRQRVESAEWTPQAARHVTDAYDWLGTAKEAPDGA